MGNASSSKDRHEDTVDFGALTPQGIYTGVQDWNQNVVAQAIVERKLAPFYRPLEDYQEDWDDDRILAARKDPPPPPPPPPPNSAALTGGMPTHPGAAPTMASMTPTNGADQQQQHGSSFLAHAHSTSSQISSNTARPSHKSARAAAKEPLRITEAKVYKSAVECPICFMYYPPNINRSRCCDQAICTECFVQIKRSEPTPTHLVSEPACCPYCVQENFGVVYTPPSWRAGIGADIPLRPELLRLAATNTSDSSTGSSGSGRKRRKSTSHTSTDVVTIDQIRPDWEAKLNAVKAAVARRANRRIIMRQVGDRLIPVGVTSGRVHPLGGDRSAAGSSTPGDASAEGGESSGRRSRRRNQVPVGGDLGHMLNSMGVVMGGQDLEELLLQEAMRLSLLEHEAEQRRNQQQQQQAGTPANNNESAPPSGQATPSVPSSPLPGAFDRGRSATPDSPAQAEGSRARSVSPGNPSARNDDNDTGVRRRSHAPIVSSPLGNAGAAIALAIGLPSSPGTAGLAVPSTQPRSSQASSRSNTPAPSTRTHSRRPSQTPSFSVMAAAIGANNTANAFLGNGSGSSDQAVELPVVVSPTELNEDIRHAHGHPGVEDTALVNGLASLSLGSGQQPESSSAAATNQTVNNHDMPPASSLTINTRPPLPHLKGSMAESMDSEDSNMNSAGSPSMYKVLPSTPDLVATQPLLPGNIPQQ